MKKNALLFALFVGCIVLSGAAIIGYQDIAVISTPGNPASGYDRLFVTSGGGLGCLNSSGGNCIGTGAGSPLTTKGDLYTYGTTNTRLGVGTNGQTIYANSGATNGIDWEAPISLTTTGSSGAATYTPGNPNVLNIPNYAGGASGVGPIGTFTCSGGAVCTTATGSAIVTTAGSTITISSIPAGNNMTLMICGRTTDSATADNVDVAFNGDATAGNYALQYLQSAGSTASGGRVSSSGPDLGSIAGNTATASRQGCFTAEFNAYAGTTFQKIATSNGTYDNGVSGSNTNQIGLFWLSTAAISSLTITSGSSSNFIAGTYVQLNGN